MIVVLMGPAGAGKSTVGQALAAATGWRFYEADDAHPASNVAKMRRGIPLDDRDRQPWLARLRELLVDVDARREDAVLACSALRQRYRNRLAEGLSDVRFVMLRADRDLLAERLASRKGHFAGPAILEGQLADLEVPETALILDAAQPVAVLVSEICSSYELPCNHDR